MVSLTFTLPLPPGVNNAYVTAGRRRVLSKPAKTFKNDAKKHFDRMRSSGELTPQQEAAVQGELLGVYFTFHFSTPFRRDLDGGLKIALDALCECLGVDDRMVVSIQLEKRVDTLHPRLEVELETIDEWSFDPQYVLLSSEDAPSSMSEDALE